MELDEIQYFGGDLTVLIRSPITVNTGTPILSYSLPRCGGVAVTRWLVKTPLGVGWPTTRSCRIVLRPLKIVFSAHLEAEVCGTCIRTDRCIRRKALVEMRDRHL